MADGIDLDDEEVEKAREMFDANIPEVDIVSGPASGMRFIVMKAEKEQDPLSVALLKRPPQHPSLVAKAAKAAKSKETPVSARTKAPVAPTEETPAEEPVVKADEPDLDAGEVLVGNPATAETATPASPGWEQIDADTAAKWTAIASRLKIAVETLADREAQEAISPDGESADADNAYDLEGAAEALDWVIGILAPFAVGEQLEADEVAQDVMKALAGNDPEKVGAACDVIVGLRAVRKAGRVLSATNEQAIRDAVASLTAVLSSLPQAPVEEVTKSKEAPVEPIPEEPLLRAYDVNKSEIGLTVASAFQPWAAIRVRKAKGDPMVACYNANGDLIGVVDPDDLVTTAAGKPAEEVDAPDAPDDATAAPAAVPAPAAGATAPQTSNASGQAPGALPVAKSQDTPDPLTLAVEAAVSKALQEAQKDTEKVVKELREMIDTVGHFPAAGGPRVGAMPQGSANIRQIDGHDVVLRSQSLTETPEIEAVRKEMSETRDEVKKAQLGRQLTAIMLAQHLGS